MDFAYFDDVDKILSKTMAEKTENDINLNLYRSVMGAST